MKYHLELIENVEELKIPKRKNPNISNGSPLKRTCQVKQLAISHAIINSKRVPQPAWKRLENLYTAIELTAKLVLPQVDTAGDPFVVIVRAGEEWMWGGDPCGRPGFRRTASSR